MKFNPLVILSSISICTLVVIILRRLFPGKVKRAVSIIMPGKLLRNKPGLQTPTLETPTRPAILPINISQDAIPNYQKLGFVHQENSENLPLFGRPKYQGSDTYEYYVKDGTRNNVMIPIETPRKNNNELNDDDTVQIKSLEGDYSISLYDREPIRYIPYM